MHIAQLVAAIFMLVLLFVVLYLLLLWESSLLFTRAPFISIPAAVLPFVVDALELQEGGTVFDLGCGDARVLMACAEKQPKASYIGIDRATVAIWFAKFRLWRAKSKLPIKLIKRNFFKCDMTQATHVFTYLFPGLMDSLLPYLEKNLKPGTRLVSCDFIFTKKEPIRVIDLNRPIRSLGRKLYVYQF